MPAYDSVEFDPPAPLAYVVLRAPTTGMTRPDTPMLLDTGADVSLIPERIAQQLGATIVRNRDYELVGFDGSSSFAPVAQLEVVFCRRTFRGRFLLVDQTWGILGRNILNAVPLLLDGPKLTWEEVRRG